MQPVILRVKGGYINLSNVTVVDVHPDAQAMTYLFDKGNGRRVNYSSVDEYEEALAAIEKFEPK